MESGQESQNKMRAQEGEGRWNLFRVPSHQGVWHGMNIKVQNPMLGPHEPNSLDTGELTEYCGVLPLAPTKSQYQTCQTAEAVVRYGALPASVWVYRGTAPRVDVHVTALQYGFVCPYFRDLL